MNNKIRIFLLAFSALLFIVVSSRAQLQAPGAAYTDRTNYPVFGENDPIYIFCSTENSNTATLRAVTKLTGSKTWLWEKFNPLSGNFDLHVSVNNNDQQHQVMLLSDGCYRVTISKTDTVQRYRAWVFNSWYTVTASIPESNCDFFTLQATLNQAFLEYYDLASRQPVTIAKKTKTEWKLADDILSVLLTYRVNNPPTKNTKYAFVVSDQLGCGKTVEVTYTSIVTKAVFQADPMQGEAPLEVKFSNKSENGDAGSYEWFFFRNLDDIKRESEKSNLPIDSIELVAYDDNPIYTYEKSGSYMVKLEQQQAAGSDHMRSGTGERPTG